MDLYPVATNLRIDFNCMLLVLTRRKEKRRSEGIFENDVGPIRPLFAAQIIRQETYYTVDSLISWQ